MCRLGKQSYSQEPRLIQLMETSKWTLLVTMKREDKKMNLTRISQLLSVFPSSQRDDQFSIKEWEISCYPLEEKYWERTWSIGSLGNHPSRIQGIWLFGSQSTVALYTCWLNFPTSLSLFNIYIQALTCKRVNIWWSISWAPGSWQREKPYNKPICIRNFCRCLICTLFFFFNLIYFNSI